MQQQNQETDRSLNATGMQQLERRMYLAFGAMIALMVLVILLSAGAYFRYSLNKAQDDLSTLLTRILADSVSRISFSGKYQARLLLEDIKKQHPDIHYLLVADTQGEVIAHSTPQLNDTRLAPDALAIAQEVLRSQSRSIRTLSHHDLSLREVTLPYYSGFDHQLAGVIQVGVSDRRLFSALLRGGWFALLLGSALLTAGLSIGFFYINRQFVSPVRLMASQLEGLLANSPNLIAIRNRAGELITCSNAFRRFFGLSHTAQQLDNSQLYQSEQVDVMDRFIADIRESRATRQIEITVADQSGQSRIFQINGFPILSDHGEVQLVGTFGVDLTDLRATEQALRRSLAEVEQASAAKSEFLSRMSHELRTPLNAIIGFSQVLQNDPVEPLSTEQQDNVDEILQAGRHLLELINEILDLARVESGHLEISLSHVPVSRLFDECRPLITPMAEQRGITLVTLPCCPSESCCCRLVCDHLRTRQILINLLSNAVKYNRDNGFVTLGCRRVSEGVCRIMVQDTGNGIDPDFLPHLFDPFARAVPVGTGVEGTGIGLALAKRLVEAMGGQIGVESQPGVGSLFWFELPSNSLMQPDEIAEEPDERFTAFDRDPDAGRSTILSIEDDPANQRLIRKLLANRPAVTMLEAVSAEDGLELLRNCRVDLILMDINLPGMDGFEALAALRCVPETADLPVIAISANAQQSEIDDALVAGFAAYLIKPVDVGQLLEQIDQCITPLKENTA